jgi:hypothetical protein
MDTEPYIIPDDEQFVIEAPTDAEAIEMAQRLLDFVDSVAFMIAAGNDLDELVEHA